MPLLRDNESEFRSLVSETAQRLAMPEVFIEKDYWVTELLRGAAQPVTEAYVVFKGGTSLSKAYRLIRRFSEDVDVLLVVTREPSKNFGKGSVDKILKAVANNGGASIGIEGTLVTSSTGVHRTTTYNYEALYRSTAVSDSVKLEMGTRGGPQPSKEMEITSYIAEAFPEILADEFGELAPVRLAVLAPERTLLEKMALVHDLASRFPDATDDLRRAGRHFYDILCLLRAKMIVDALKLTDVPGLSEEIRKISIESFRRDVAARPSGGFSASPAFDQTASCFTTIHDAYGQIDALLLDELPPLEEVFAIVGEHASLL